MVPKPPFRVRFSEKSIPPPSSSSISQSSLSIPACAKSPSEGRFKWKSSSFSLILNVVHVDFSHRYLDSNQLASIIYPLQRVAHTQLEIVNKKPSTNTLSRTSTCIHEQRSLTSTSTCPPSSQTEYLFGRAANRSPSVSSSMKHIEVIASLVTSSRVKQLSVAIQ